MIRLWFVILSYVGVFRESWAIDRESTDIVTSCLHTAMQLDFILYLEHFPLGGSDAELNRTLVNTKVMDAVQRLPPLLVESFAREADPFQGRSGRFSAFD